MQTNKKRIKIGKYKLSKNFQNIYNLYVDNKIKQSLKAIEKGEVFTIEQVRKEVDMWK